MTPWIEAGENLQESRGLLLLLLPVMKTDLSIIIIPVNKVSNTTNIII